VAGELAVAEGGERHPVDEHAGVVAGVLLAAARKDAVRRADTCGLLRRNSSSAVSSSARSARLTFDSHVWSAACVMAWMTRVAWRSSMPGRSS
jgi:hypothetical protein